MTTVGQRSTSLRACVNTPGNYYVIDATGQNVTQVPCPINTYGPGLKKQRACVPCPTGFTTNLMTSRFSPTACSKFASQLPRAATGVNTDLNT
jgi:hypothetical protein